MITRGDWLKALEQSKPSPPDTDHTVLTSTELARVWGCGQNTASKRAQRLVAQGLAMPARKIILDSGGRLLPVAAFRLEKAGAQKGKKPTRHDQRHASAPRRPLARRARH